MGFPKDFVWGAAAASYQVEGAAFEDGRGPSVWDTMCRWPGKVAEGHTGEVGCDHYHRYAEDAALMGQLGLNAYRLSISWSRVLPEGTGRVNKAGLDFYDRLIDALLAQGVQPWVTLFHWDFPHALYCRGGWLNRDSADWFAEYTAVVADRLSDRVRHWMTQNEPQCFLGLGHYTGEHAPGVRLSFADVLLASHNALRAHGLAVQTLRARARIQPSIGIAPVGVVKIPATPADTDAARRGMFETATRTLWSNTWFADPMVLGHYPEDALRVFGADVPAGVERDYATIRQPLDFYGVNIYNGQVVRTGADGTPHEVPAEPGTPLTHMDWRVTPECLYWGPRLLHERYGLPIVITENGMAGCDWVHLDGRVHDAPRIDFLQRYLRELRRAVDDGVPVHGYFLWSILDNFEWAWGYKRRFGIVHVDYATGVRTPKDSAYWYRDTIATNGANL